MRSRKAQSPVEWRIILEILWQGIAYKPTDMLCDPEGQTNTLRWLFKIEKMNSKCLKPSRNKWEKMGTTNINPSFYQKLINNHITGKETLSVLHNFNNRALFSIVRNCFLKWLFLNIIPHYMLKPLRVQRKCPRLNPLL